MMRRSIFITATDTDAGKTWVAEHFLQHLRMQNFDAQALKPIASGISGSGLNEDVEKLLQVQTEKKEQDINFHTYQNPVAPALAGQLEAHQINTENLLIWIQAQEKQAEITLIEGVGGLMAPLVLSDEKTWLVSDWLAAMPAAEIMLVVPLRLGCMNHLLLTCALLATMKRAPAWIVFNDLDHNDTGEDVMRTLRPFLKRYFDSLPHMSCIRHPSDLASIL